MPAVATSSDWYYGAPGSGGDFGRANAMQFFAGIGGLDLTGFEAERWSTANALTAGGSNPGRIPGAGVGFAGTNLSLSALVIGLVVLLAYIHWAGTRGLT